MSQKALTVYVDTIINLGKTAKRRKFAKINIRKKCLKHNSLHCLKKLTKSQLNRESALTKT